MASFTRVDYERVLKFADRVATYFDGTDNPILTDAVDTMDAVEGCIGQCSQRSNWTRIRSNIPKRTKGSIW